MVAAKAKAVRRAGLLAIICIGETESQRTAGNALWRAGPRRNPEGRGFRINFQRSPGKHLTTLSRISLPEDLATDAAWTEHQLDLPFIRPGKAAFAAIPAESIDYAVMEHCPGSAFPIKMVPVTAATTNTLIHATSRLVAAVGVDNLVIIETADAVLVAERGQSQDVKQLVAALESQGRSEHRLHRKVHRPWGWYDSIDEAARFKVKRILVKPKESISLQMHHHRAEHWIVVKGTAEVTCGDKTILLTENQSTYIPIGEMHRLANPGMIPLEIIEVQSGSCLDEGDIVRFEDRYGRTGE